MNYINLHNHSVSSALDSVATIEQLVDKAMELNQPAIAITEHGNFNSIPLFQSYCLEKGIKPILGVENYIVENLQRFDDKEKRIRDKNSHVVLHAMNKTGWKNLMRLNYLANSDEEHFYYKPRNSIKELFEHSEGIMLGTACLASEFANLLKRGEDKKAEELFQEFLIHFNGRMYGEVQLNECEYDELSQKQYNEWIIYQSTKNGIPIVLSGDTHYINKNDWTTQQMAFAISRDGIGEENQHVCKSIYFKGIDDYKELNKALGFGYSENQIDEWCGNSVYVGNKCDYIYKPTTISSLPRMAFDEEKEIKKLAIKGMEKHFNKPFEECPKEYVERLKMEMSIITKKGMMRYFLVLKDILDWCDEQKIPRGVSRGSAGSSVFCCCLGITKWSIDPITNQLLFERFISEDRLPDAIYRYNIEDAELIKNENSTFEDLKSICSDKLNEFDGDAKNRLIMELYRAKIAYDNGINIIDTILSFKENINNAYIIPYILGATTSYEMSKPVEIQSLGLGSAGLDIDTDISGKAKDMVFQHLQEKYGKESVCYIGTYTEEGIKPAVKDILRKEEVSFKESNDFCACFPDDVDDWESILKYVKTNNPAQYGLYLKYQSKLDFVPKLQHFIRGLGAHAGGQIIFNKPVYEYVPVNRVKGEIATAWVENGANTVLDSFAGVIKYDILGLNTLDIIDECVESIEEELVEVEENGIIKILPISAIPKELLNG